MKKFFVVARSQQILNFNVLRKAQNSTKLISFIPFNNEKCNDVSEKLISEYTNGSWSTENFLPNEFKNLHGCSIKISAVDNAPAVIKTTFPNGSYALDGIDVKLIREAAKTLNFFADIESSEKDHGALFEINRTATGNVRHAISGNADMLLGSYYLTRIRTVILSNTHPYRWDSTRIVVASAEVYSPLEKLLLPFDSLFFAALGGTVILGFVCLHMLQRTVNDSSVNLLNLITVLLGGSQTRLPRKLYLKILFFSFASFCLIVRTSYQGSLFKILQSDNKKKGITSIDEMVEKGFTFYVSTSVGQTTENLSFFKR